MRYLVILLCLSIAITAHSQDIQGGLGVVGPTGATGATGSGTWTDSAGALFPTVLENNVGIGTSSPSSMLTVRSGDYNTFTVGNRMVWLGSDTATEISYSGTQLYQQSEANIAIAITGNSASNKGIDITGINSGGSENAVSILGLSGSMTGRGVYISGSNTEGAGDIVLYPQQGNLILQNLSPGLGKVLADIDGSGKARWMPSSTFQADSATIYALTPSPGTQYYCTDCSGNGITGRIVAYIAAAWRRLNFED